jgi:hypothetical protein
MFVRGSILDTVLDKALATQILVPSDITLFGALPTAIVAIVVP